MKRTEEARLAELARTARNLRECISAADSMIRSWANHKADAGEIYLSLSDRRCARWHTGVNLPASVVQESLIPVLKRIRAAANKQIKDLSPEIKSR